MRNLIFTLLALFSLTTIAQTTNTKNVALGGYDVVNYFTNNTSIEGSQKYSVEHNGIHYYFANTKNKELFKNNPSKYKPQFGGFCAAGVALSNGKFPVNPENFKITNGKLYLFYKGMYKGKHFDGKEPWLKNEKLAIKKGNKNWSSLKSI